MVGDKNGGFLKPISHGRLNQNLDIKARSIPFFWKLLFWLYLSVKLSVPRLKAVINSIPAFTSLHTFSSQ
jgi:hypothetical protein